jgi:hypothetical protein
LWTICQGWPETAILISAPWVAGITGMSRRAWLSCTFWRKCELDKLCSPMRWPWGQCMNPHTP